RRCSGSSRRRGRDERRFRPARDIGVAKNIYRHRRAIVPRRLRAIEAALALRCVTSFELVAADVGGINQIRAVGFKPRQERIEATVVLRLERVRRSWKSDLRDRRRTDRRWYGVPRLGVAGNVSALVAPKRDPPRRVIARSA